MNSFFERKTVLMKRLFDFSLPANSLAVYVVGFTGRLMRRSAFRSGLDTSASPTWPTIIISTSLAERSSDLATEPKMKAHCIRPARGIITSRMTAANPTVFRISPWSSSKMGDSVAA
jgi:hypothetical protein